MSTNLRSLEQLETNNYSPEDLYWEINWRFYRIVSAADMAVEDAARTMQTLKLCGYTYFEALYLICGEEIQNCELLSERTQQLIKEIARQRNIPGHLLVQERGILRTAEECLNRIFQEDSDRLDKLLSKISTNQEKS